MEARMSQMYEGPLPAPSDFAAYKETLPSAPERIMTMAEYEQDWSHKAKDKVINYGLIESIIGMILSFVIVVLCVWAAVYLAMHGHEVVATALIGIVATLATIFYLKKTPSDK